MSSLRLNPKARVARRPLLARGNLFLVLAKTFKSPKNSNMSPRGGRHGDPPIPS